MVQATSLTLRTTCCAVDQSLLVQSPVQANEDRAAKAVQYAPRTNGPSCIVTVVQGSSSSVVSARASTFQNLLVYARGTLAGMIVRSCPW